MVRASFTLLRAAVHVAVAVFKLNVLAPHWSPARRSAEVARWAQGVFDIFDVQLRLGGRSCEGDCGDGVLFAGNHVSWLDIFALLVVADLRFVAKSEVRGWPVVGRLAAQLDTLFITRERRSDARNTVAAVSRLLAAGHSVCIFPEGTSTEGRALRPFHSALFEPAARGGFAVQPFAVRYLDASGEVSAAAAYAGDMSLAQSLWKLAQRQGVTCELTFLPPIEAGADRRELALAAERAVAGHAKLLVAEPPALPRPAEADAAALALAPR